ncbi:MAG: YqjF family protein [Ktedonobacterales bacterium]
MNARALLNDRAHRPWPLPAGPWVMTQTWSALLFAHWPLAPDTLRSFVPPQLALDTWEGEAWIGVVPFRMTNVRPRLTPPVPGLSAFPELNVRTYVTYGGKPGVWFFSLDAANPVAVAAARALFALPYFRARMTCERMGEGTVQYRSVRTHHDAPAAALDATYRPVGPAFTPAPGTLEQWLTERYCLYAMTRRGKLLRGEIHHRRWRLRPGEAEIRVNMMARAAGFALADTAPLLHVAERQETLIWAPYRVAEVKV